MTRKSEFTADDAMARVAVASMTTMAKAQGQDVTEDDQEQMLKQAKMEMSAAGADRVDAAQKEGKSAPVHSGPQSVDDDDL